MAQTSTACPRCRQPVRVEVEQLFDLNVDPKAKQRLLSGNTNHIQCPNCNYDGTLATPIVYHDPEKELLLTYFPHELGLPLNEQERVIGPLITQVTNKLPPEKRKAYLFRPQTMFTYETLIERILEGDGITKDMLQAQQARINLLQRLLTVSPESRAEVIRQEEKQIDQDFFALLNRLAEVTLAQGDQQTANAIASLQQDLLTQTETGRKLKAQAEEVQASVKLLQDASKQGMTRSKLLDILAGAPSDAALTTLVSLARSGMDYNFFEILSDRIDHANGEEKQKLVDLRDKLLSLTQEIDQAVQAQVQEARELLNEILNAPDPEKAFAENIDAVNDFFIEALKDEEEQAREKGDLERLSKINKLIELLQKMSAPSKEIELVQTLLQAPDESARRKILEEHADEITPELIQMVGNLASQSEAQGQSAEVSQELQKINRQILRFSMELNLKK